MLKKLSEDFNNVTVFIKQSPLFSHWRTILFGIMTLILFIIVYLKFDFGTFYDSIVKLNWQAFVWLALLSIFEQILSWERYLRFLTKFKYSQITDYVAVSTIANVIPPKPLGIYYRFILTKHLFKTKIKETVFQIALDTAIEGIFIGLFAVSSLFLFPKANLGLEILLYLFGALGLIYFVISYYETRVYLIKNFVFRKLIMYLSKIKTQITQNFFKYLKSNMSEIIIGSILTIVKLFVGVLKVYLLFLFFGLDVSFWICFGIWGIAFFVGNASSLPAGLGAFELSFVYLAKSVNIPETMALNVALIERIFNIWIWVIFTLIYLFVKQINIFKIHEYFLAGLLKISKRLDNIRDPARKMVKKISKQISEKIVINKKLKLKLKKISDKYKKQ